MAGLVGWRAGSGGGQGGEAGRVGSGRRGMDLWSKELSGVNIVTKNLQRVLDHLSRILGCM